MKLFPKKHRRSIPFMTYLGNRCINEFFSSLPDIVFFIYLYQRWIYRIDPKRVNEFGYTGEDLTGKQSQQQSQPDSNEQKSDKKND